MSQTCASVLARTLVDGGGTFDTLTFDAIRERDTWAVGCASLAILDLATVEHNPGAFYGAIIDAIRGEHATFGTWVDTETMTVYVDAVALVDDIGAAVALAVRNGERAIYNLGTHETIRIVREPAAS